jgi:hypothetical protein
VGHEGGPRCGGTNRQHQPCGNSAGYKTDHPGSGNCAFHGGSTPSGKTAAMMARATEAVQTYGLPRDISPTDALLEEVRYSAGHVAWLREMVQSFEAGDLVWGKTEEVARAGGEFPGTDTTHAATPNIWLELYYRERKHLLDVTKAAIAVGIEERRVRLAEAQGAVVADVIRRILARLSLSDVQSKLVPSVVPEELRRAAVLALN